MRIIPDLLINHRGHSVVRDVGTRRNWGYVHPRKVSLKLNDISAPLAYEKVPLKLHLPQSLKLYIQLCLSVIINESCKKKGVGHAAVYLPKF